MASDDSIPLVSYVLLTYNHEDFIDDAIQGVLSQDYPNLEIIISDDASTDSTYDRIKEHTASYQGPARIITRRNDTTVGLAEHINIVSSMAAGQLIVAAAGDDIPAPDRVSAIVDAFEDERVYAVHSNASIVDAMGRELAMLFPNTIPTVEEGGWRDIAKRGFLRVSGSTLAIRRDVYDVFGPLPTSLPAEDQVLAFRAALLGKVVYLDRSLVSYRLHGRNLSHWGRALEAGSVREILAVKWKQSRKSLEEKLAMLSDLEAARRMGRAQDDDYQQARESLESRIVIDRLRCVILDRNRPWVMARLQLALRSLPQVRSRKMALRLLCISLSPPLFYWAKRLMLRPSIDNRFGMDSRDG